ncbi:MAG TPA: hypothetical protein VG165_06525 [Solirubrobacteraceae bacterium]|jgi:hypothetical protein|nr:hypothetical protein [Solirubrobacteraceae bacterium]
MHPALVFGAFPLGLAGTPDGLASGAPDDFGKIFEAVTLLQGDGPPLLPRMYVSFDGPAELERAFAGVQRIASPDLAWDLALSYRDPAGDVDGWADFVGEVIARHGHQLAAVQVTGEANLAGFPAAADGAYPRATEALIRGVQAAAASKRETGATAAIGFAAAFDPDPEAEFWAELGRDGGEPFVESLDYVGVDMYPDVFGPRIPPEELDRAVGWVLRHFRERSLSAAGIPASVPIRICESGWPTGPGRSEQDQAVAFETIIRAVHRLRGELNITHWELFTLRDADTAHDDMFRHFGILRDDYSRKPAFDVIRRLIAELGDRPGAPPMRG